MNKLRQFREKLHLLFRADVYVRLLRYVWPYKYAMVLVFTVLGGLMLWLVGYAMSIVSGYVKNRVNSGLVLDFKCDLFNHLQHLSLSYHDQTTVGDSVYRLNSDTGFISTLIWGNFRHLATAAVTLVGIVCIVVRIDWQLALLALATAPLMGVSLKVYN